MQYLCDLVDPSGDYQGDRRSGENDPDSGAHGRDDQPHDPHV